ncbi:MAG: sterol desaturase family protein [Bradymonadaceae bacterium]
MFIGETPDSPRIFDNEVLDRLTRTHWLTVPTLYLPASIALIWYSVTTVGLALGTSLLLAVGGAIAWTLTEYFLHRVLFHWIPEGDWGDTMHFFLHGVHHDWPDDKYRLVMPPAVSLTLFVLFLGIWTLTLGAYGWAWHAGFTFGYMCYDVIHYVVHHHPTPFDWLRRLKRHHISHHFHPDYEELRYGVSTRLWDFVFGTEDLPEEEMSYTREKVRGEDS